MRQAFATKRPTLRNIRNSRASWAVKTEVAVADLFGCYLYKRLRPNVSQIYSGKKQRFLNSFYACDLPLIEPKCKCNS